MTGIYDVTEAFVDLLTPVLIHYAVAGAYSKGKWGTPPGIPVAPTPGEAVIHPMSENEINKLKPEGYDGQEMLRFYFPDLISSDITRDTILKIGDVIEYKGFRYTALKAKNWKQIGGYFTVYAERKD